MAKPVQPADRLLQRPLYIFDLPEELLYTLQLKLEPTVASPSPPSTPTNTSENTAEGEEGSSTSATSCTLCSLSFPNLQEQRSHVRSDLHGYNLKQKIRGRKPVTEAEFEQLVGELDESISGSDSSDSDDGDEVDSNGVKTKESTLTALLKRQAKITDGDAEDAPVRHKNRGSGKPPLVWFTSPRLPSNTSLGVYRALFSREQQKQDHTLLETIQKKQLVSKPATFQPKSQPDEDEGGVPLPASMIPKTKIASGPHYFLCMTGGGHFAAMLVSLTPKLTKNHGVEDRAATVIAHKTFHRYTTRRKQGGSQSANDNAKGNAHSAGSSIRRYNETALEQEARELLGEWRSLIESAELLFVRASGSTSRRTLFGPSRDYWTLDIKDERIRGFPFNTRRATQAELMRAFVELTRMKVHTVDEVESARQAQEAASAAAAKAENAANGKPTTPKAVKPSKEDEEATLHTTQLQALIRRSKAPGMLSYIQSNNLSPDFHFFPPSQNHHAPTPLHLAAALNSAACISSLLVKAGADPTIKNEDGKPAFDIAGDRPTRDAFRLARSQLGEDRWAWDDAAVPPALTQSEVDSRTAREKQEKAEEEEAEKVRRKAEVERIRQEDSKKQDGDREKVYGKGRVMERREMTGEERRELEGRGMSEEMKKNLERERRARAAEERMKRLQGQR